MTLQETYFRPSITSSGDYRVLPYSTGPPFKFGRLYPRPSFQIRETSPQPARRETSCSIVFSYVLTTSSYNFFFGTIITTPYQRVSGFQLFFPVFSLGWDRLTVFWERMTLFSYGTYLLLSRLRVCTLYTLITFIFMYCSF